MSFKTFVSMNIAIIGSEEIAGTYARNFALAGHNVFMACREGEEIYADALLDAMSNVHVYSIEAAAEIADIIIVATAPKHVREVAYWLGDVRRKVIIDASANVNVPDDELVKTVYGLQAITASPYIVKVFSTKGYEQLLKPLFGSNKVDMILLGDSKKAKELTKILSLDMGMNSFHDFGGNDNIPLFNEMTRCWRNLGEKHLAQQYAKIVR